MRTPDDIKARVSAAYNHAADFYDHSGNAFWDRAGRRTVERLEMPRGARVLDLCCGTGASAIPAAERVGAAGQVVAVDLAEELIRIAAAKALQRGLRNVEFRVADILALEFDGEPFDFVVCVFGIFFLPDMPAALQQMWQFVRPGGRIAVTTWGNGLFEPVDSLFWESVRRTRPDLYKSFNPWERVGEPALLVDLFADSRLPRPEVVLEAGMQPLRDEDGALALMMGTGYRGVIEQLSPDEWLRVRSEVDEGLRAARTTEFRTDILYAVCSKAPVARLSG